MMPTAKKVMPTAQLVGTLTSAVAVLELGDSDDPEVIAVWREIVANAIRALLKHVGETHVGYFTDAVHAILISHGANLTTCHKHERAIGHLVRAR